MNHFRNFREHIVFKSIHAIDKAVKFLNRFNLGFIIFIVLCINFLSFELFPNEEHYFSLAKQYIDPSWIPHSFLFTDWIGERFLFQNIIGFFLKHFSFEQVAFWGRLLNFLFLSIPISRLFKLLKINNIEAIFILQIIYFSNQAFIGGEWIFMGLEPKTFAYIFVFYALYFLLTNEYWKFVLCTVAATYIHFLVGGWFFFISAVFLLCYDKKFKPVLKYSLVYFVVVLPFIIYIIQGTLAIKTVVNGVRYDWLIVFFRNPHHAALFNNDFISFKENLPKIILLISCYFTVFFMLIRFSKNKDIIAVKVSSIFLIIASILIFSIIASYFDTTGFFLKLLPFRIAALGMFIMLPVLLVFSKKFLFKEISSRDVQIIFLIFSFPFLAYSGLRQCHKVVYPNQNIDGVVNYVRKHTLPTDIFIFWGTNSGLYDLTNAEELSFSRKSQRDQFVVYKFVPYGNKIYEWYDRLKMMEKIEDDLNQLFVLDKTHKIDYVISTNEIANNRLLKEYDDQYYKLYRILK